MIKLIQSDLTNLGFIYSYIIKPKYGIYYISDNKYLFVNEENCYFITEEERNKYQLLKTNNLNREIYRVNYNILFILEEDLINRLKEQEKLDKLIPTYTVYNFIKNELNLVRNILYDYKDIKHYDMFSLKKYINTLPNIQNNVKIEFLKNILT